MSWSKVIRRFSMLSVCWGLLACGDDDTSGTTVTCGEGTKLKDGACVLDLGGAGSGGGNAIGKCADGTVAVNGECRSLGAVGASCTKGPECVTSACLLLSDGFVDGYCTAPNCNDNNPCPGGSHCYFSAKRETALCLAFCDNDDSCREGYVCQELYGKGKNVCTPRCDATDSCPDQTQCDTTSGKCLLRECDPKKTDACGTASSGRLCYPDSKGLTKSGGLCVSVCDPAKPKEKCQSGDVCQPLPTDSTKGICVPPVCTTTADCPAGATCGDGVCKVPATCDDEGKCADDKTACVGGKGGKCMPLCPSDGKACSDTHAGLTCAQGVAAKPVCLPVGSFPGSTCRADKNSPCDKLTRGAISIDMACENNTCLPVCTTGGNTLCKGISSDLNCATGVFDTAVCLPSGKYPGAPCAADNKCDNIDISANVSAKMVCAGGQCLPDCGAGSIGTTGAETYCSSIDTTLSCATGVYANTAVCLPAGTYPGGPCSHGTCGNVKDVPMTCSDNTCIPTCVDSDKCSTLSADLVCARGVLNIDVCLPKGAFPGGPCGGTNHDTCSQDLNGVAEIDMRCVSGTCVVGCGETGKYAGFGESVCQFVDSSLTCADAAGSVCVKGCGEAGACDSGYSCLDAGAAPAHENACLP
ncbi:MAG: hypothetical protein RL701_1081, partial [Pseudomonadota bacterium]